MLLSAGMPFMLKAAFWQDCIRAWFKSVHYFIKALPLTVSVRMTVKNASGFVEFKKFSFF
jgi:hypothetical protein